MPLVYFVVIRAVGMSLAAPWHKETVEDLSAMDLLDRLERRGAVMAPTRRRMSALMARITRRRRHADHR